MVLMTVRMMLLIVMVVVMVRMATEVVEVC